MVYSNIIMITIILFLIAIVKVLLHFCENALPDVISTRFMMIVVRSVKNCFWKESHVTVFLRGRRNHHTLS